MRRAEQAKAERYFEEWRKNKRSYTELRKNSENFGVKQSTFYDWVTRYDWHSRADQLDAEEQAHRKKTEAERIARIAKEMEQRIIDASSSDWKAALAWLKANVPDVWGDRQKLDVQETRVISQETIREGQESVRTWLRERLKEGVG